MGRPLGSAGVETEQAGLSQGDVEQIALQSRSDSNQEFAQREKTSRPKETGKTDVGSLGQRETPTASTWSGKARLLRRWLLPAAYFVGVLPIVYLLSAIGAANPTNHYGMLRDAAVAIVMGAQLVAATVGAIGPRPAWIRLPASLGCALVMPLIALTGATVFGFHGKKAREKGAIHLSLGIADSLT